MVELHTILSNTVNDSIEPSSIQVLDGFKNNFYLNYQCYLAQQINIESTEFKEHYERACREGSEPFKYYRLMIVGPEGVGKTSLLRALTGQTFQEDENTTKFVDKYNLQVQKLSHDWSKIESIEIYKENIEQTRQDLATKNAAEKAVKSKIKSSKSLTKETSKTSSLSPEKVPTIASSESKTFPQTTKIHESKTVTKSINSSETSQILNSDNVSNSLKDAISNNINESNNFSNFEEVPQSKKIPESNSIGSFSKIQESSNVPKLNIVPNSDDDPNSIEPDDSITTELGKKPVSISPVKRKGPLGKIQSLKSKFDFLTAWDFAGQNYLYCFHSIFLSPRSVYIIPIDLTIKDLNANIEKRKRNDRHDLRSNSGVPRTYMEVYEFWLGAIYSVCKTLQITGHYNTSKIIFVFTKADKVPNAKETARTHFEALKLHLSRAINAFSLVHDGDELFLLSCKTGTKYFEEIAKLKAAVKRVSDQVAFERPIPIKWLKLANEILKEKLPILDRCRIQFLVEKSDCSKDIKYFLQFFHEIGFFFCKQDTIIIDIQCFLNLLYHILFPSSVIQRENISIEQFELYEKNYEVGKISLHIFEKILDLLQIRVLGESVLELLQLFGILVRCQSKEILSDTFYIPYLLTGSLNDIKQCLPPHTLIASFFIYFPDGFLPASLYFTLLSKCIRKSELQKLSESVLGFDCAIFYVCDSMFVALDYFSNRDKILINFYSLNAFSTCEEETRLELVHYLIFLQLILAEIQTKLIPSGNLAKIMFSCHICNKHGESPSWSLDSIISVENKDLKSFINLWDNSENSSLLSILGKSFCCSEQLLQIDQYKQCTLSKHHRISFSNSKLAEFILNNREKVIKRLNWKHLTYIMYVYGLISVQRYTKIIDNESIVTELSEELLWELVHKGPEWAIKFYFALRAGLNNPGHYILVKLIDNHMDLTDGYDLQDHQQITKRKFRECYKMNKNRHGIAFIVNVESFEYGKQKRKGSIHDVAYLKRVFDTLQYDFRVFENVTLKKFLKALKFVRSRDHSNYDSFFCIIMSHGNDKGEIIFANNKPLSKSKIVSEFSPLYCKGLESKPKMFLFQACRGNKGADVNIQLKGDVCQSDELLSDIVKDNRAFNTNNAINPEQEPSSVPIGDEIDIFIGDSTVNQYVSYRNESKGTFFIQSFCSVMESCSHMEFTHIMMEVRRKVSLFSKGYRQCTVDTNTLKGQVYF